MGLTTEEKIWKITKMASRVDDRTFPRPKMGLVGDGHIFSPSKITKHFQLWFLNQHRGKNKEKLYETTIAEDWVSEAAQRCNVATSTAANVRNGTKTESRCEITSMPRSYSLYPPPSLIHKPHVLELNPALSRTTTRPGFGFRNDEFSQIVQYALDDPSR